MEQINEIENLVKKIISENNDFIPLEITLKMKSMLLSSNIIEMLQYHYSLLKLRGNKDLYYDVRAAFKERPKEIIEAFLLQKLAAEKDVSLKADVVQLLGNIRSTKILPYAIQNIKSEIRDIRYRCIIVVGWVGSKENLPILNERLLNEPDDELRGYAATAMRQIWFKKKATAEDILPYLYAAIVRENNVETLAMIIIVIQDLLKRKFGMQERIDDGTITGDAIKAKQKIIKALLLK
ncbi:hypothetical protein ABIB40_003200 [Pedobacter sp. UYP30]|uniref:HEAT repeat domain-containing protein n=1 Tax=Pedobacter sp. UYP30 TaxID=1756400 RepID=UPI003397785A